MRKTFSFIASMILIMLALPATALASANLTVEADGGDYNVYCLLTGSPANPGSLSFVSTSFPRDAWNEAAGREIPDAHAAAEALPRDDGAAEAFGEAARKHGTELAQMKAKDSIDVPAGIYLIVGNTTVPYVVSAEEGAAIVADVKARRAPEFTLRVSKDPGELAERIWLASGEKAVLRVEVEIPDDYDRYEDYQLGLSIESGDRVSVDGENATAVILEGSAVTGDCTLSAATPHNATQIMIENLKETLPDYTENTSIVFTVPISANMEGTDGNVNVSVLFGAEGEDCHKTESHEVECISGSFSITVDGPKADGTFVLEREGTGFAGENGWIEDPEDATEYTPADGKIKIDGIAPGTYFLHQVKAPTGQRGSNEPVTINVTSFASKLSATIAGGLDGTALDGVEEDEISITVVNETHEGEWANTPGPRSSDTAKGTPNATADMIANGAWALALAAVLVIVFLLVSRSAIRSRKRQEAEDEGDDLA